jgi:hypothetical protein
MASRLQDVIQRGLFSARPLATAVAPGTLYYSTDAAITERSDGTTWQSYVDGGIFLTVTPATPVNGQWWVECTGTSPTRIAAIKIRDGGVTRTIASITF